MSDAPLIPHSEALLPRGTIDGQTPDTTLYSSLWDRALLRLESKHKAIIASIINDTCRPDELLRDVNGEVEKCQAKKWQVTRNGRRIFLRDVLTRIAGFLQKITNVMDALVQYDPGHLSIPWAFARFLLMAAMSDTNTYAAFLESMEIVTDIISRYTIVESIYLQPGFDCTSKLESSIISLYTVILQYLCKTKLYFGHNTMIRLGISVLKIEQDASKLIEAISKEEDCVEKWLRVSKAQLGFRTSTVVAELHGAIADFRKESDDRVLRLQTTLLEMEAPVCRMPTHLDYIYSSMEGAEKVRVIKWVSSLQKDYEQNHSTTSRFRLKGSGEWLLRTQRYRHWLNSSSCSVLWLWGGAGYGKTFLVSLIIDQERQRNPLTTTLAYFYCTRNTAEPKRAQPVEILRSIVRQLSCSNSQSPIRKPVIDKWNERVEAESDHGLDVQECVALLLDLTRDSPAVICIDALDECDIATRKQLLNAIDALIGGSEQIVKVFVSSRREPDFVDYFTLWEAIEICAEDNREDIAHFIDEELEKSTRNKTLLNGKASDKLIGDVRDVLVNRADGMFRWVSASLQTLCDPLIIMEVDVRDALGRLPDELKDVYDIIAYQIQRRPVKGRTLAENVLKWLLFANKPLPCQEMVKAATANEETFATTDDILSLCSNFVKLDEEIGVFQFVHLSVREYLEGRPEYQPALCNATIADSCLQACLTNMKPKPRYPRQHIQNKTFYNYAQIFWPFHCQMADEYRRKPPLEVSFRQLVCTGRSPCKQFREWLFRWSESWNEMELDRRRGAEMGMQEKLEDSMDSFMHGNPIFLACVFGFTEIIDDRRQAGLGDKDSLRQNVSLKDPYQIAIRYGQKDVISILRSNVSLGGVEARESALLDAVSLDEKQRVAMLLTDHPDLEITDKIISTAATSCGLEMMEFLAERASPGFQVTEQLILTAARNESHGQDIVRFLFEQSAEDVEYLDPAKLLVTACGNSICGLNIVNFIMESFDDISISDSTIKAAACNPILAYQLLRILLDYSKNLRIWDDNILEVAACNPSPEPVRLLLSSFPTIKITWITLQNVAQNTYCGDTIMTLLLDHSKEISVDEDLLLSTVSNEKLGVKLLYLLLPKAPAAVITNDVLRQAAWNWYLGHKLIGSLLVHAPPLRLEPALLEIASQNPYCAPEIAQIILNFDNTISITTASLEEAAAQLECGEELLQLLLNALESDKRNAPHILHDVVSEERDSTNEPHVTLTRVVEVAASNSESGSDVMKLLLKWDPDVVITPLAVTNAAGNSALGMEIINIWRAHKRMLKVTPEAIEAAAGNDNMGLQVLHLLLRLDRRVDITDTALEAAASNPYFGLQMVRVLLPRWHGSDGWEQIISGAVRNTQCGDQVLAYLLSQKRGSVTAEIIETCTASHLTDQETIRIILDSAPGVELGHGFEIIERASNQPRQFFDILGLLKGHDANISISEAAIHNVIGGSYDIIENIRQLHKYHSELKITEGILKSVIKNIKINESTLSYLCEFQEKHSPKIKILPITEEIILAGLQNSGDRAPSAMQMLLTLQPITEWVKEEDDRRLEVAAYSHRAESMIRILAQHYKLHNKPLRITLGALEKAATNRRVHTALKTLLKLLPESDNEIIASPRIIQAAACNPSTTSHLRSLIEVASHRNVELQIDQAVFESAIRGHPENGRLILRLWETSRKFELIHSCVTEEVLESAAAQINTVWHDMEGSLFHFLFRMQRDQGALVPITARILERAVTGFSYDQTGDRNSKCIEYFLRIIRQQKCDTKFEDLITAEVLTGASCSRDEHLVSELLDMLPPEKRDQYVTREGLLIVAASGSTKCLDFLLEQKPNFQQNKQYYRDISELHVASVSRLIGKQRKLLRRGVYCNAAMHPKGRRLLSYVIEFGDVTCLRTFIRFQGFDLDATDSEGETALHVACERGYVTAVELLLAQGADPQIKNNDGKTAEDVARANYHYMAAQIIRDWNAAKISGEGGAAR